MVEIYMSRENLDKLVRKVDKMKEWLHMLASKIKFSKLRANFVLKVCKETDYYWL